MIKFLFTNFKIRSLGFTMVEMLVYLSIFTVVSTASVAFIISLDDFIDQYRLETMLYRSGTNVMEQIMLAIRQADNVDLFNTIEDDPSVGRLTVENTSSTTSFTLSSNELELEIDGFNYGDLTNDSVVVDKFTVYYYSVADVQFVRVRLALTATIDSLTTKSETFYGGGVIRGAL